MSLKGSVGLPYRTLPQRWDVVVAGGGTAGAIAGVAAAREGARVLVTEAQGSLGGTGTNAWVTPLMKNVSAGERLNRGLTDRLKAELLERGDGASDQGGNDNWFNPEGLKYVLEEMLLSAGGEVLYHTSAVAPLVEDQRIEALVIHNKGGLQALEADVFIDATGDADVAAAAGVPFHAGDEDGGAPGHEPALFAGWGGPGAVVRFPERPRPVAGIAALHALLDGLEQKEQPGAVVPASRDRGRAGGT